MIVSTHSDASLTVRRGPTPADTIRLRIVGTERNGQVIELTGSRNTIGAARSCTVRLRAAGVRPLHCLIVRGLDGPVVRSLSSDTLLNGSAFREQSLRDGDRLHCGPIILEALVGPADFFEEFAGQTISIEHTAGLPPERELTEWSESCALRPADVLARLSRLEQELQNFRNPANAAADELASLESEKIAVDRQLAKQQTDFEETRGNLESQLAETTRQLANSNERLADERRQLEQTHRGLSDEVTRLTDLVQQQQSELKVTRAELQAEIDRVTAKSREDQEAFETARQRWAAERQALTEQLQKADLVRAALESEFQGTNELFQAQQQLWLNERQTLEASLLNEQKRFAEVERQAAQEIETLKQRLVELEQRLNESLPARSEPVQEEPIRPTDQAIANEPPTENRTAPSRRSEIAWLAAQFAATNDSLPAAEVDNSNPETIDTPASEILASDRAVSDIPSSEVPAAEMPTVNAVAFDVAAPEVTDSLAGDAGEQVEQAAPEFATTETAYDLNAKDETSERMEQVVAEVDATDNAHENLFDGNVTSPWQEASRESWSSEENFNPPESQTLEQTESKESAGEVDQASLGESEADVFDRLQRAGIWRTEDESADVTESEPDHQVDESEDVGERASEVTSVESEVAKPSVRLGDDEDSIESYMQRLMQRVRGVSGGTYESGSMSGADAERTPVTEIDASALNVEQEQQPLTATEYLPRSHAPELNADLAAMRRLANESRHRNIMAHAERTWTSRAGGKLVGCACGFSAAIASLFFVEVSPLYAWAVTVGGTLTGAVCFWQAMSLRRRLFNALKLDIESVEDK